MVSPPAGMAEVKATKAREERMESFILTVFVGECGGDVGARELVKEDWFCLVV